MARPASSWWLAFEDPSVPTAPVPAITSLTGQNRLIAAQWTPPPGVTVTSTTVTVTATGQSPVSVTVSGAGTTAVLDGVAPLDASGAAIMWSVTAVCADGIGGMYTSAPVVGAVGIVKPTSALTGVPVGASGDIRPSVPGGYAGLTPISAATMTSTLTHTAGANITGYDVDCTGSSVILYADDITFRNCRFTGISSNFAAQIGTNGGSVWRRCTFIDCEFDGQGTSTLAGSIAVNTGDWVTRSFIRCEIHGFIHLMDNHVGDIRHCYLHDTVYQPGANPPTTQTHSDTFQWDTPSSGTGVAIGPIIIQGCALVTSDTDTANSMTQVGQWNGTSPNDSIVGMLVERNWFHGNAGGYFFAAFYPTGQDPTQAVWRNNTIGLNVGTTGLFYPSWRTGCTWTNNVWETTGTNSLGQSVTAGQVIT